MKPRLDREEALAAARAARDAYHAQAGGGTRLVVGHAQALLRKEAHRAIVAFAGTNDLRDMLKDAKVWRHSLGGGVRVHKGFWESYLIIREQIIRLCLAQLRFGQRVVLTGHSLGAAMMATAMLRDRLVFPPNVAVYLFGCPTPGNAAFAAQYGHHAVTWRFEHNNDFVARSFPAITGYRHVGRRVYIDRRGALHEHSTWIHRAWDRLAGRARDLGRLGTDGLKDHGIGRYVAALEGEVGSIIA